MSAELHLVLLAGAVHSPNLAARSAEPLNDNLGALDVTLTDDAVRRLEAAAEFTVGFSGDFIAEASRWVFGEVSGRLDGKCRPQVRYWESPSPTKRS